MHFEWDKEYSVGVELIDNQHKELFNRANQLFDAMKVGKGKEEILETLKFLEKYVITHFAAEEEYMKKIKYKGFDVQHAQHEEFKKELTELKKAYETKGLAVNVVIATQKKIYDWLRNHIIVLDKQIGQN